MKQIKYLLYTSILWLLIIPVVYAANVEISSIELDSKSDNAKIESEPTFNGLEMNYDVFFKTPSDFVKYKVTIKNNTNKDYKISEDTSFNKSAYINYEYDVNDTLKAKSEAIVYVTITYSNEVSNMVDNKYSETNKAIIQLINDDEIITNPNTGQSIMVIIIVMIISFITIFLLHLKRIHNLNFIVLIILAIPTIVLATETLKLTINVNIKIEKGYRLGYLLTYKTLIPEREFTKYEKTKDSECEIVYYNGEKHYNCSNIIYIDPHLHLAGEKLTLDTFSIRYVYYHDYSECELQSDESYYCPSNAEIPVQILDYWRYDISYDQYGFEYRPDDRSVMNIDEDKYCPMWLTYDNRFCLYVSEITMPAHDTLFFYPGYGS